MNKEISRSPKKHEFLLNLAKSPPLSVDHFDFLSMQPHSKDSFTDGEDQISLHQDRLATATDYISGKNFHAQPSLSQGKRSHSKKKSVDNPKDAVTYLLSTPSSTTNAKAMNKSSQSRTMSRSNTAHHLNFLNSKEFAKFALSKVLPRETKKDKAIHLELSPPQKKSQAGSLEKSPSKVFLKEEPQVHSKFHMGQTKKQKVKPRASNLTYNDFSSLVDQTRQTHSFMNSPQKKSNIYISIPPTKSTTNLRPTSTKNSSQTTKNAWQQASNEAFRRLEANNRRTQQGPSSHEKSRSKERNKGIQSIASILNLRRDKKSSPEKKANSCYPASNYHRKVASIGAHNTSNHQTLQSPVPQGITAQEGQRTSLQRSPSQGKKSSNSPLRREPSAGKKTGMDSPTSKGLSLDQYAGFQNTFEFLLEKYRCDMQNSQETYVMLKQAKQAYESFIKELLTQIKNKKEVTKVSTQDKELKLKYEGLAKEKEMLEDELRYVKLDNERLYALINDNREKEEIVQYTDTSRKGSDDNIIEGISTCPPTQKMSISTSDNLKKLVVNQQNMIAALQDKEVKLMQLLYTIHKQGFDVENLIREEVLKESNHSERQFIPSLSKDNLEVSNEHSGRDSASVASRGLEICSLITSQDMSDILPDYKELKAKYGVSDAITSDSSPYLGGRPFSTLSAPLKNKLKLDFKILPNTQKSSKQNVGSHFEQQSDKREPLGFHDEFMARIEEFSPSWRLEAMNLRNI